MKTQTQKNITELVDFSIKLGQHCWQVYSRSKAGFARICMLPNGKVRRRANELFLHGFSGRMLRCPTPALDSNAEMSHGEEMWKDYLTTKEGKVVLDSAPYPNTPGFILGCARGFFLEGFRAGNIAVQEIFQL